MDELMTELQAKRLVQSYSTREGRDATDEWATYTARYGARQVRIKTFDGHTIIAREG